MYEQSLKTVGYQGLRLLGVAPVSANQDRLFVQVKPVNMHPSSVPLQVLTRCRGVFTLQYSRAKQAIVTRIESDNTDISTAIHSETHMPNLYS